MDTSSDKDARSTANDNLNRILGTLTSTDLRFNTDLDLDWVQNADTAPADPEEVFFTGSFQELLTNHMEANLALDIQSANTMLGNYETVSQELYVDRDGVMGVDLNDETIDLMMYQKSFAASCRLMTVFDEMVDKLVNGTAV